MCVFFSVVFLCSLTRTSCIVPSSAVSLFVDTSTHCTSSGCIDAPVTTHVSFLFWSFCLCSLPSPSSCGVPLLLSCAASPLPPGAHRINPLPWPLCRVNAPGSVRRRHPGLCTSSTPHRQRPGFCASSTPRPLRVVNAPTSAHHQCPGSLPIPLRPVPTLPPGFFRPASGLLCLPLLRWRDGFWSRCPYPRAALHRLWQEE